MQITCIIQKRNNQCSLQLKRQWFEIICAKILNYILNDVIIKLTVIVPSNNIIMNSANIDSKISCQIELKNN